MARTPALPFLLSALAVLGTLSSLTYADVQTTGNVIPARNPFDPINEPGLPTFGNFINPAEEPDPQNPTAQNQTNFEGLEQIIVGETSFGAVLISSNTHLRYQDLIIGDTGLVNSVPRFGTGVVRISGFGALYNNDPTILPFGLDYDTFGSRRDAAVGFDLYVGRNGIGTLEITAGGRAEIQDGVAVGSEATATGTLIVDGIDSYLGNGGFESEEDDDSPSYMNVGRFGVGYLTISNGATVQSEAPGGGNQLTGPVGAVIGGERFTEARPDSGGSGTASVIGPASRWVIGGSLQVGGFDFGIEQFGAADLEGDDVIYTSNVGRGILRVLDGGVVTVRPPAVVTGTDQTDLLLAIGRFGRVELDGGFIVVGNPIDRDETVLLLNDGLIQGSGRIETGIFRNRFLGEVRVGAGQKLLVDATAGSEEGIGADPPELPLANWGLIEVIGTEDLRAEFEIERSITPDPDNPTDVVQPFLNLPIAGAPGAFQRGLISAQNATLRFRSGIVNQATMAFTGGTNIVSGHVHNVTGPVARNALFSVGPGTTVVVEDNFTSGGVTPNAAPNAPPILAIQGGGKLLVEGDMTLTGFLDMELSFSNPSTIQVSGDVGLNATLFVSFDSEAMTTLGHGDAFELMYFAREIGGVDNTDPANPIPDLTTNPILNVATDANFNSRFPNLNLIAMPILQSYYLFVLDPSMVGPVGASGPDFNGDGVVDQADLDIWLMFVGITDGASVLQGDADGDGDVDGDDFLFWQRNAGQPPPWTIVEGSLGNGQAGAVPEPTGIALVLSGVLIALACRRSRARQRQLWHSGCCA